MERSPNLDPFLAFSFKGGGGDERVGGEGWFFFAIDGDWEACLKKKVAVILFCIVPERRGFAPPQRGQCFLPLRRFTW